MLWKYEPVVLAILAVGASILMENHHRIDMTPSDDTASISGTAAITTCQATPQGPRLGVTSAVAAEGKAALLTFGNRDDLADACAVTYRNYSAAASAVDSVAP